MSEQDEPRLPAALRRELSRLWEPPPLPSAVDAAIRRAAHRRLAGPRRRKHWLLASLGSAAAAGLLALVWWAAVPFDDPALVALAPADVDGSGRVDILDAWSLARRLRDEAPLESRWDLDRDGDVDDGDVRAAAQLAVRIDR